MSVTFESEWMRCGPWLQAALDSAGNLYDLAHVEAMVRAREATFWPGVACAVITQVDEYPNARVASIWLTGGDLRELRDDLLPRLIAWARERGCSRMWALGRPGWAKILAPHGLRVRAHMMEGPI